MKHSSAIRLDAGREPRAAINGHELGGQRKRVTILFADIRNFTTMSEQMPPEEVVDFLNDYFSEMVGRFSRKAESSTSSSATESSGASGRSRVHEPEKARPQGLRMTRARKLNGQRATAGKPPSTSASAFTPTK